MAVPPQHVLGQSRNNAGPAAKPGGKAKGEGKTAEDKKPEVKWLPPPYEPQLLRLSELMGALDYLEPLCGAKSQTKWRRNMQQLIQIESKNPIQKARLAGAFNAGYRGYALNYRTCTDNAQLVISRYLIEGERIARDVASRYGGG
jgi:uncharacterized protein (TIGR02301 family)